jgi:hypothetical protein
MNPSNHRYLALASASLVALGMALACGSLDDRDVTRVPDGAGVGAMSNDGGAPANVGAGAGPGPGAGGSSAENGGDVGENPFGGDTFTGGAPAVDGAPEVIDVLPADGADDADPSATIGLKFSEGLDASTVTSDSVQLLDGATPVAAKLAYAGVTATLKPSARLALLGSYEIQATPAITDVSGQPLKQAFSSKFTVRDGIWGDRGSVLKDQTTWAGEQDIGSDAEGNLIMAWTTKDPVTFSSTGCTAAHYSVRTGWAAPVSLTNPGEDCGNLRLAMSPDGNAVVAWFSGNYPDQVVRARRYVDGAWEPQAVTVDSPPGTQSGVADLAVAVGGGQGLLAWVRGVNDPPPADTGATYLYLSSAALDRTWPSPIVGHVAYRTAIQMDSVAYVGAALDPEGNSLVVFNYASDSTAANSPKGVYFVRKAATGEWQTASKIPSSLPSIYPPTVVSDGDGAMAVWANFDAGAGTFQVLASRYTKTRQFIAPVPIQDPDLQESLTMTPAHAMSSDGKSFFATWTQAVGPSRNAYVSRYSIAAGKWDARPIPVNEGTIPVGEQSTIGLDAHGNAIVAFDEGDATSTRVSWTRFTASTARWSPPAPAAETDMWFQAPLVSVASNGTAALLFASRHYVGHQADLLGCQLRLFQ